MPINTATATTPTSPVSRRMGHSMATEKMPNNAGMTRSANTVAFVCRIPFCTHSNGAIK